MGTYIINDQTPKTAAQAWAAIHKACGNAVRAQLEDDDVDGAIWYAKKMAKVEARFPADHPIHKTAVVINSNLLEDCLSPAEAFALGLNDHEIVRHTGGIVGADFEPGEFPCTLESGYPSIFAGSRLKAYKKKLAELFK